MKSYTYLIIDFFTILIPFVFSFHPKLRFDKRWPAFFPAMAIAGFIFLVWDEYFTRMGVWGFNPDYLVGLSIFNLPLEEILFFVCIPYACVFTYHCFQRLKINPIPLSASHWITSALVILLGTLLAFHWGKWYTSATFLLLSCTLIYLQWIRKMNLSAFYFTYLILLVPFGLTNGILTGSFIPEEVVWYNNDENLNFRLGTIPFEDIFYGMMLILWNVALMEYFSKTDHSNSSAAG
ncbi:MAG: lycopene cyclase domain-containing protein [Reichenbachiella sp.]|uniref:lycopene cyclase domain-containing protein n=1 Tax=Reichenbachiella sp. TaxID=2184521 RepID=UPI0032644C3E